MVDRLNDRINDRLNSLQNKYGGILVGKPRYNPPKAAKIDRFGGL